MKQIIAQNKTQKSSQQGFFNNYSDVLLASIIFVFALCVRGVLIAGKTFPLGDGGMFYSIIQYLLNHNFAIPHFLPYNEFREIPFSYPPLAFYLTAFFVKITTIDITQWLLWLPIIFSSANAVALYVLARNLDLKKSGALLATLIMTLNPFMLAWHSMGGGITRALGLLFCLLACSFYVTGVKNNRKKLLLLSAVLGGLTILTHLEAGTLFFLLVTAYTIASRKYFLRLWGIIVGTLVVVMPWVFIILLRHGIAPFLSAFSSNIGFPGAEGNIVSVIMLLFYPTPIQIGFYFCISLILFRVWDKNLGWLLGSSVAMIFLLPRSFPSLSMVTFGLLFATIFEKYSEQGKFPESPRVIKLLLPILLIPLVFTTLVTTIDSQKLETLTPQQQKVISFVQKSFSNQCAILVLDSQNMWTYDYLAEWLPALTPCSSPLTIQGTEWKQGLLQAMYQLRLQVASCSTVECVEKQTSLSSVDFSHILVEKTDASSSNFILLAKDLEQNSLYSKAFDESGWELWEKKI